MGYYREQDYGIIWTLCYYVVQFLRQMAICIVGVALIFAGDYICNYEANQQKQALQEFLQGFSRNQYMDINDFVFDVPEGVTVHSLEEVSYRTYDVEASAGGYSFKGTVSHGSFRTPIQYTQSQNFWDKGVVLSFAGEILAVLGLTWVLVKYVLGVRSWEELRTKRFFFGHC